MPRARVKSGCRTCRIRKVKCDEGYPVCQRCISTGRPCDGYAIKGGGGNAYHHRSLCKMPYRELLSLQHLEPLEQQTLQWFLHHTTKKYPGVFSSAFWDTLVLQSSLTEPAVLHAMLALACTHRMERFGQNSSGQQDCFILRQYNKSIRCLQPHFMAKDNGSIRVALITCVLFICLECLRGYYRRAIRHLTSGLKVLPSIHGQPRSMGTGFEVPTLFRSPVDNLLAEILTRFQTQTELYNQGCLKVYPALQNPVNESGNMHFASTNEARQQLDRLLSQICHLAEQYNPQVTACPQFLGHQKRLQDNLACWLKAHKAFLASVKAQFATTQEICANMLLDIYHTTATIMVNACSSPTCETVYDDYTTMFVHILNRSIDVWRTAVSTVATGDLAIPMDDPARSSSVADLGWIPPLYYTAIKCRSYRVRFHAIRLLNSTFHKEGIWDSKLAAAMAQSVMEIEEGGNYTADQAQSHFSLYQAIVEEDLSPILQLEECRVHNVELILPDDSKEQVHFKFTRRRADNSWETLTKAYNLPASESRS